MHFVTFVRVQQKKLLGKYRKKLHLHTAINWADSYKMHSWENDAVVYFTKGWVSDAVVYFTKGVSENMHTVHTWA